MPVADLKDEILRLAQQPVGPEPLTPPAERPMLGEPTDTDALKTEILRLAAGPEPRGAARRALAGFGESVTGAPGKIAEGVGIATGSDALTQFGQSIAPTPDGVLPYVQPGEEGIAANVGRTLGSGATFAPLAALGGPLGIAAVSGSAAAQAIPDAFYGAKANGADDDTAWKAALVSGIGQGALETVLGPERLIGKIAGAMAKADRATGGLGRELLTSAAGEGIEEASQSLWADMVAQDLYKVEPDEDWATRLSKASEQAAYGALGGGVLGSVALAAERYARGEGLPLPAIKDAPTPYADKPDRTPPVYDPIERDLTPDEESALEKWKADRGATRVDVVERPDMTEATELARKAGLDVLFVDDDGKGAKEGVTFNRSTALVPANADPATVGLAIATHEGVHGMPKSAREALRAALAGAEATKGPLEQAGKNYADRAEKEGVKLSKADLEEEATADLVAALSPVAQRVMRNPARAVALMNDKPGVMVKVLDFARKWAGKTTHAEMVAKELESLAEVQSALAKGMTGRQRVQAAGKIVEAFSKIDVAMKQPVKVKAKPKAETGMVPVGEVRDNLASGVQEKGARAADLNAQVAAENETYRPSPITLGESQRFDSVSDEDLRARRDKAAEDQAYETDLALREAGFSDFDRAKYRKARNRAVVAQRALDMARNDAQAAEARQEVQDAARRLKRYEDKLTPAQRERLRSTEDPEVYDRVLAAREAKAKGRFGSERALERAVPSTRYSLASDAGAQGEDVEAARKAWKEQGTDSPWFRRWFAGSKVVDGEGKPLVVYHGTNRDFTTFSEAPSKTGNVTAGLGHYFSADPDEASRYTRDFGDREGGRVLPVYLSIQNPYEMTYREWNEIAMRPFNASVSDARGMSAAMDPERMAKIRQAEDDARQYVADLKARLIAEGYDGIQVHNGKMREYVAFDSAQIKSATGNRGTFSPANPDIRYSLGQEGKKYRYRMQYRPAGFDTLPSGVPFTTEPASKENPFGVAVYDKPLPFKDEEAYQLEPLDPNHPKNIRKTVEARRGRIYEALSERDTVEGQMNGRVYVLGPDTRRPDKMRLTSFDPDGTPTGHMELGEISDAMDEAARMGFEPKRSDVRFSLASDAGARGEDVEAARKAWKEQGTESPWFKRWFGQSKVVDGEGKPLVVYHGTQSDWNTADMQRPMRGYGESLIFLTPNPGLASEYAQAETLSNRRMMEAESDLSDVIFEAFEKGGEPQPQDPLGRSKNYVVTSMGEMLDEGKIDRAMYDRWMKADEARYDAEWGDGNEDDGANVKPVYASIQNPYEADVSGMGGGGRWDIVFPILVQRMVDGGHDGLIVKGVRDAPSDEGMMKPETVIAVRRAAQIKSATGNRGTFSPANPDIRYSLKPTEALGVDEENIPRGSKAPNVDWESPDLQDSGSRVTPQSVLKDYGTPGVKAHAYRTWVTYNDIPNERLVEEEERKPDDWDDDEMGEWEPRQYDWSEYSKRNTFPPAKLRVTKDGEVQILDGNHRLRFWGEAGFEYFPAIVIDERPGRSRDFPRYSLKSDIESVAADLSEPEGYQPAVASEEMPSRMVAKYVRAMNPVERKGVEEMMAEADAILADRGAREKLARRAMNHEALNEGEQIALQRIASLKATNAWRQGASMDNAVEAQFAFQQARTTAGRVLGNPALRDALQSPAERAMGLALSPSKQVARAYKKAKTWQARRAIVEEEARKIERIRYSLAQKGFDPALIPDDYFKDPTFRNVWAESVADAKANGKWDWYIQWRRAAMLSGPITTIRNVTGNTSYVTYDRIARIWADAVIPGTGTSVEDARVYTRDLFAGIAQGWKDARAAYSAFYDASTEGTSLDEHATFRRGPIMVGLEAVGIRAQAAQDIFFRSVVGAAETRLRARQKARAEGGTAEDYMSDPDVLAMSKEDMERALFLDRDALTRSITGARDWLDEKARFPVGTTIVPFAATPTKIVQRGGETLLGPLGGYMRDREKWGGALLGAGAWAAMIWAASMFDDDDGLPLITGSRARGGQGDFQDRTAPAYSIRIGDEYYSYQTIEPLSTALAAIADAVQSEDPMKSVSSFAAAAKDKSFFRSIETVYDAIVGAANGERGSDRAKQVARDLLWTPMIPNIVRSPVRAADETRRKELGNPLEAEDFLNAAVPTGDFGPPLRYDLWGRPAEKAGGSWVSRVLAPAMGTKDVEDVEKIDLLLADYNRRADEDKYFSAPAVFVTRNGERRDWTEEEYSELTRDAGARALTILRPWAANKTELTERDLKHISDVLSKTRARKVEEMLRRTP